VQHREIAPADIRPAGRATGSWKGIWTDRILGWRDGLLKSPRFRRGAAAFPLTRPVARRRARALFDLVAGFVYSQVLVACVQLRLFDILSAGPQQVAELAGRCRLPAEAMQRLLAAAESLGLVARRRDGRYGLGSLGAAMVGNPAVAAMVEHHAPLYADLADPVALLRGRPGDGALAAYWSYAGCTDPAGLAAEKVAAYTALMAASNTLVADEILDAYPVGRHRRLLDVGGGDGSFLAAVARRHSSVELVLFDLPAVAERARERFAAEGIAQRATVVGGSFLRDPLPGGADLATLVRVIHDHDDAAALAILKAAHAALVPDGRLLLAEPMSNTPGAEPVGAYFSLYLLAMGSGRPRTVAQLSELLHTAGFARVRPLRTRVPLQSGVLIAQCLA
jgi:demethylspheroidene O-methyltransferase